MSIDKSGKEDHTIRVNHLICRKKPGQVFLSDSRNAVSPDSERPAVLRRFARDVSDDIRSFGTLPRYTISRISHAGNETTLEDMAETVKGILSDIETIRGANYLDAVRRAAESDSIVVTVEKN